MGTEAEEKEYVCRLCGKKLVLSSVFGKRKRFMKKQCCPVNIIFGCPDCSVIVSNRMLLLMDDTEEVKII